MLQKITIPIRHGVASHSLYEVRVWAWVQDGWALHRTIGGAITSHGNVRPLFQRGWTVTHVKTRKRAMPNRDYSRKDAVRIFHGLRNVSVNGKRLADMTQPEVQNAQLDNVLHELFSDPNARYIGGNYSQPVRMECHQ